MPWNMMDALHHILAAAVLFVASWAIKAWRAYRADSLESNKAIYQTLDDAGAQVSHA